MYTSFIDQNGPSKNGKRENNPPNKEDLASNLDQQCPLTMGQRIMNGRAIVKRIVTNNALIVYHEDFMRDFYIRVIPEDEDIENWINLQEHSNVLTAYDTIVDPDSNTKFSMAELTNHGNMYQYIESLKLDLAIDVPRSYLEMIYDAAIQLATGLDFAHNSGLVHGVFDLSKVVITKDKDNLVFKITDFAPAASMLMPVSSEANYWPFSRQKKNITDREKLEVLMLKDIYSLGICILEMMIGRFSKKKFSISLDSLPLTWAEFPESTPLIQVLVDCIQIDSITQRKGRLQSIRKLLIREFKKFFGRKFYKMENPFVGNKADVLNKKGIVALFKGNEEGALDHWRMARTISDSHFDSQFNFVIHRWSNGVITNEQLKAELGEYVFQCSDKGQIIEAALEIAQGNKDEGLHLLKLYVDQARKQLKNQRIPKQRIVKNLALAEQLLSVVLLDKETFYLNFSVKHGHSEQIQHISFSSDSSWMVAISTDSTSVWKIQGSMAIEKYRIPSGEPREETCQPCASIDNAGSLLVIHRGKMIFTVYELTGNEEFNKKEEINLPKEIQANGNPGFSRVPGDKVMDIRFLAAETTHMRVNYQKGNEFFFIDVQMHDSVPQMRKARQWEDKSIFQINPKGQVAIAEVQDLLLEELRKQSNLGNKVCFPEKDTNTMVILNRQDKTNKFFEIFDIRKNGLIRKTAKKFASDEAFNVDQHGRILVHAENKDFNFELVKIPNAKILCDILRPRIQSADAKLSPAAQSENKQQFKDKLYRDLHTYHLFKADPEKAERQSGIKEEQNLHLMVRKYEEAVAHKYKLKANRELLMMQKVLLRDAGFQPGEVDPFEQCPLVGVDELKRIEVYDDELAFASRQSQIHWVTISSEPHRNFFLLAMDGIVYKYDLVNKELLFQFKTNATKEIIMFDKDDKLLVASHDEVRLWDFHDHKEEVPDLITQMQSPLKISSIFINRNCRGLEKELYVVIAHRDEFILYSGRMNEKARVSLKELEGKPHVCSAAFSEMSDVLMIGTNNGKVLTYSLPDCELQEPVFSCADTSQSITHIQRINGMLGEPVYLLIVDKKEAFIYSVKRKDCKPVYYGEDQSDLNGAEICKVQVAENSKFFVLGLPEKRALGFFMFDKINCVSKPLKWITKYQFVDFYTDDHLQSIMFLNKDRNTLDYNFILWKFNTSKLDHRLLHKLDNGVMGDEEDESEWGTEGNSKDDDQVKADTKTSCCTIF